MIGASQHSKLWKKLLCGFCDRKSNELRLK